MMVEKSILKTVMLKFRLNGFTLLEMLVVMLIVTLISSLTLLYQMPKSDSVKVFEQHYLYQQVRALALKQRTTLPTTNSNVSSLTFNARGAINQAQTIKFKRSIFVVQLGMGRYVIR